MVGAKLEGFDAIAFGEAIGLANMHLTKASRCLILLAIHSETNTHHDRIH